MAPCRLCTCPLASKVPRLACDSQQALVNASQSVCAGVQDAASDVSVRKPSDPIVASASGGPDPGAPLAIIIEPTRELALQTAEVLNQLKQYMIEPALRVVLLMGGMDSRDSVADLRRGCDVVVVTPGLMRDLVNSGKLNMSAVRIFVIDEADRMTDAENLGIVMDAFTKIPKVFKLRLARIPRGRICSQIVRSPGCYSFGCPLASLSVLGNTALAGNRKTLRTDLPTSNLGRFEGVASYVCISSRVKFFFMFHHLVGRAGKRRRP